MSELVSISFLILIVLITIGILLTLIVFKKKKEGKFKDPDYRAFFILGICFLPVGIPVAIAADNPGLLGLSAIGIVYIAIGLANRDKWKEV